MSRVPGLPWQQPFCGEEFYGPDGRITVCDGKGHPHDVMHSSSESGFTWWGFMSYPRTGGK